MKQNLIDISNSTIDEILESELRTNQRKYEYHKKICQGYYDLMQQTIKKLEERKFAA